MVSGSHDQTKAAAVPERTKCARLPSAHAHQGRGAGRFDSGPQQREGKAAPRLEWLSRMACASGGALHSVRLRMGGAPRRSLPRGTGWAMRVNRDRSSAPQVVRCGRRYLALAARPKCVRYDRRAAACRSKALTISAMLNCCAWYIYSITSSARASSGSGMTRPRALAVLRLTISSTLVVCWTGRSAGFSPLRTRPVYAPACRYAPRALPA